MYPGGYTAEVTTLSPKATEKDVYDFFNNCGNILHLEIIRNISCCYLHKWLKFPTPATFKMLILSGEYARTAYVTFNDAFALETAVLLSGATIADQRVCIAPWGISLDESDPWNSHTWHLDNESSSTGTQMSQFVSTPGEAVTVAQEVVKTMIAKGYVLGTDALMKAKAFDESHQVSSRALAKVAELSNKIGLTDKVHAGIGAVKSVDDKFHLSETTISVASYTGRTAVAAANAVVNSSYFAKGALLVSDALTRAAKVAADLGSHGVKK